MSTITSLTGSDGITTANSMTKINTNFSNLNTDKIETSTLDTDTSLAANSDSKIATQKAVKTYVDASVNPTGRSWNEYAADAGSTDAYAITVSGVSAYVTGQTFKFKANTANTGAATLNVNSLGAKTIKKDVTTDLATGDILANQIVTVIYDGTNMQLISKTPSILPVIRTYTSGYYGDTTSQFDITNPSGSTFRYTWDGNGTNPGITATTFPTGSPVVLRRGNNSVNTGQFTITGSGANYFEVSNGAGATGTDHANYTIQSGRTETWTKPNGLLYIKVKIQAGGGGGAGNTTVNQTGAGGAGGGYAEKIIAAASLGSTETVTVGPGGAAGVGGSSSTGGTGTTSSFGSHLSVTAGSGGVATDSGGVGGTSTTGDLNIPGGNGSPGNTTANVLSGYGGTSFMGSLTTVGSTTATQFDGKAYGSGGSGARSDGSDIWGGMGGPSIIIVEEYYG